MKLRRLLFALRNWKAHWRAWFLGDSNTDGEIVLRGALSARVLRGNGKVEDLGVVARRVVTTAGVNFMRDDFNGGAQDITTLNHSCLIYLWQNVGGTNVAATYAPEIGYWEE